MPFDLFMVWSDLCPSCSGNTGRLLHGICKCAGEWIVAHWPLVTWKFPCVVKTFLFVLFILIFFLSSLGINIFQTEEVVYQGLDKPHPVGEDQKMVEGDMPGVKDNSLGTETWHFFDTVHKNANL